MKTALLLCMAAIAAGQTYNGSLLNLHTPVSGASSGDFEFSMNHRFYGDAFKNDPLDSFFGMDDGANIRLSMRYFIVEGFAAGVSHERMGSTNTIFGEWGTEVLNNLEFGISAAFSSIRPSSEQDREGAFLASASASLSMLQGKLRPVVNIAFDEYRDNSGVGFGVDFQAAERVALFGEYVPSVEDNLPEDSYGFGVRYNTWGHQFLLGFTNNPGIGIHELLPGSYTGDLSFALSVRRLF